MPDPGSLWLFVVAATLLAATPGPAVLYIVTRSISQGRAAGFLSCLGVSTGGMVHVVAAAFGLSRLLATSALAFALVKYAGAAYLIALGVRKLWLAPDASGLAPGESRSLLQVFQDGVMVNVLNPKTALFFLAFLPQFAAPSRGDVTLQLVALGGLFILIAFVTDAIWSLAASGAGAWLQRSPRLMASERYLVGSVYLGLGVAAAVSGDARK